jgi:hypothetical protein
MRLSQNFSFGKAALRFAVLQSFKPEKPQSLSQNRAPGCAGDVSAQSISFGIGSIIYAKAESDMTCIYFEQILDSHRYRVLRGSTFYKVTRPLTMDGVKRNVTRNDKTDIPGAVIVSPGKV